MKNRDKKWIWISDELIEIRNVENQWNKDISPFPPPQKKRKETKCFILRKIKQMMTRERINEIIPSVKP